MTDTPIFDVVNAGRYRVKAATFIGDEVVTTPVHGAAVRAVNEWISRHSVDLAIVLHRYGLHPYDISQPTYRRVVYEGELNGDRDDK